MFIFSEPAVRTHLKNVYATLTISIMAATAGAYVHVATELLRDTTFQKYSTCVRYAVINLSSFLSLFFSLFHSLSLSLSLSAAGSEHRF